MKKENTQRKSEREKFKWDKRIGSFLSFRRENTFLLLLLLIPLCSLRSLVRPTFHFQPYPPSTCFSGCCMPLIITKLYQRWTAITKERKINFIRCECARKWDTFLNVMLRAWNERWRWNGCQNTQHTNARALGWQRMLNVLFLLLPFVLRILLSYDKFSYKSQTFARLVVHRSRLKVMQRLAPVLLCKISLPNLIVFFFREFSMRQECDRNNDFFFRSAACLTLRRRLSLLVSKNREYILLHTLGYFYFFNRFSPHLTPCTCLQSFISICRCWMPGYDMRTKCKYRRSRHTAESERCDIK